MKSSALVLALVLLLTAACRDHNVGQVHVDGEGIPRFRFVGLTVSNLVVYEVPDQYLKEGIPLNELKATNPNTRWYVEGEHDAKEPIEYGKAPAGMQESAAAEPLADGKIYFASSYICTRDTGAFVGQYFRIRNGRAEEFHEGTP
jgi:hypothetical protein